MHRAAPVARRAEAVRAAARRTTLTALLVVIAFLGLSHDPSGAAARGAAPRPPASATPEPAGEGQQDTAETEQSAPGRTARTGGPRNPTPARTGPYAPEPARPAGVRTPAGPSPAAAPALRCVVLRC